MYLIYNITDMCLKNLYLVIQYVFNIKHHLINLKLNARVERIKICRVCFENPKKIYATNNCVINVAYAAPAIP